MIKILIIKKRNWLINTFIILISMICNQKLNDLLFHILNKYIFENIIFNYIFFFNISVFINYWEYIINFFIKWNIIWVIITWIIDFI